MHVYCRDELTFGSEALRVLAEKPVHGRALLGFDKGDVVRLGIPPSPASDLLAFVALLRYGGA